MAGTKPSHHEWALQYEAKAMLLGALYAPLSHTFKTNNGFLDADTLEPVPGPEVSKRMNDNHAARVYGGLTDEQ